MQFKYFQVDVQVIVIYLLLSVPYLATYLKKAKIPGAEFEFKEEISRVKEAIKVVNKEENSLSDENLVLDLNSDMRTRVIFNLVNAKRFIYEDRSLALASLRIEIESRLKHTAAQLGLINDEFVPLARIMDLLFETKNIRESQYKVLKKIIHICNMAVHGQIISQEESLEVLELVEVFNNSFSIGYSINLDYNENYREEGLDCPWEHCIELMPLQMGDNESSCPRHGHDCPGGREQVIKCKK